MNASAGKPLSAVTVLVSRPGERGMDLINRIGEAGGKTVYLPLIEIDLLPDSQWLLSALGEMPQTDLLVFVSVHAVHSFASACKNAGLIVPETLRIAAVGAATAQALGDNNLKVDFAPVDDMNSEGLLKLLEPEDLTGKKIQIYRGQSGRTLLSETFRFRGATVTEIESYRRRQSVSDFSVELAEFASADVRAIVLTSVEFVQAMAAFLQGPHAQAIATSPLAVLSTRIAEAAAAAGFNRKMAVAPATSNAGLIEAVERIVRDPA